VRPTREGWAFLALLVGLTLAAFNTGNNLLYVVLSLLLAILLIQNVLAEWNLRQVRVERRLPAEAFAFEGALGAFVLRNERRRMAAFGIRVREFGGEAGAIFGLVPSGGCVQTPVAWTFPERGPHRLQGVVVSSDFPFGLFRRTRFVAMPAALLVYPARRSGPAARGGAGGGGQDETESRRPGGAGDFLGLRPYTPGDPVRTVHWPNSARFGEPVVVLRGRDAMREVIIQVEGRPERLEQELARACGQATRHLSWSHAVGLQLPGYRVEPARGTHHRRKLLRLLALFGLDR